ncbi:MAG: cyclic nucleotide-binding domain-containing protein [Chromatiaceae bacterium]|nr:cyclic nucleotide-binding domain-containing protein [Chromatiaceae bacterium]
MLFRQECPAGATLYRVHDPCDRLYIVEHGEVELLDPEREMDAFDRSRDNDAFGRMAFFTRSPHATLARAGSEVSVWVLTRDALERLTLTSPNLRNALIDLVRGDEVRTYLLERHRLTADAVADWIDSAVASLVKPGGIPPAVRVERGDAAMRRCAN